MGVSKHAKDSTRAERKAKKRKLEDAVPDLPGDHDSVVLAVAPKSSETTSKKRKRTTEDAAILVHPDEPDITLSTKILKKHKKRAQDNTELVTIVGSEEPLVNGDGVSKREKYNNNETPNEQAAAASNINTLAFGAENNEAAPRKSKKERKAEKKAREAKKTEDLATSSQGEPSETTKPHEQSNSQMKNPKDSSTGELKEQKVKMRQEKREKRNAISSITKSVSSTAQKEKGEGNAARFIVFIGNLPFSATTESIQQHFVAVKPISVRHLTQKDNPTKSKGCAFVEFEGYDHMKTCLKLFHHSTFDDGVSQPRKINVELTAGGGGKTKHRQVKIGEKNQKLNEERVRRLQEEAKVKSEKKGATIDHNDIHPSRRGIVPDTN